LSSIRFDISEEVLMKDLIDLGLPKENCRSLTKIYKKTKKKLKKKILKESLRSRLYLII